MKKIILATSALVLGSVAAHAADGTVTINGVVTDQTCKVTSGSKDIRVTLPTVGVNSLATAGTTAGRTPFTINLENCKAGNVSVFFETGGNVDAATGNLNNATGTAKNVQVQLLSDKSIVIPVLANAAQSPVTTRAAVVGATETGTTGTAALNYYAQYLATGAATPGTVATSVQYTVNYQ
ncbi:fimbrial protein [Psychrobacter raelei]|uniref:Fimbrial protein n=1 Tax=Psychrobacter raelei TaxID=2565531 RepID=A0AAT9PHL9_9GAMM